MELKPIPKKSVTICSVEIDYFISPGWKSLGRNAKATSSNRLKLEQHLKFILKNRRGCYFSLSHTRHLGGFAVAQQPVGFDLEPTTRRVSKKAVLRFASPYELAHFNNNALAVWVAKEAAFKALRTTAQPKVVSAIQIDGIRHLKKHHNSRQICLFQFNVNDSHLLPKRGYGRCEFDKRTIMGFAVISP